MKTMCVVVLCCLMIGCKGGTTVATGNKTPTNSTVAVSFADIVDVAHVDTSHVTVTRGADGQITVAAKLTDSQKIDLLRAEAKKRHIKWRITCEQGGFWGHAWQEGTPEYAQYYEDGERDWWGTRCGDDIICATQVEAVESLYSLIQDAPNQPAEHRPADVKHPHRQCPPELSSESPENCKLCGSEPKP